MPEQNHDKIGDDGRSANEVFRENVDKQKASADEDVENLQALLTEKAKQAENIRRPESFRRIRDDMTRDQFIKASAVSQQTAIRLRKAGFSEETLFYYANDRLVMLFTTKDTERWFLDTAPNGLPQFNREDWYESQQIELVPAPVMGELIRALSPAGHVAVEIMQSRSPEEIAAGFWLQENEGGSQAIDRPDCPVE